MVFYLKSVSHEEVKIPIGRGREMRLESFQASRKKKTTIYQAASVFTTTLLSPNNCKVRAKMKTQGIPVLSNPSLFHPVPILF